MFCAQRGDFLPRIGWLVTGVHRDPAGWYGQILTHPHEHPGCLVLCFVLAHVKEFPQN